MFFLITQMITIQEFKEACAGRDEDDYPVDSNGNRLGREYLDVDPEFIWSRPSGFCIYGSAAAIRANGMHCGRLRGSY